MRREEVESNIQSFQNSQIIRESEVNSQYQRFEAEKAGQQTNRGEYQAVKHNHKSSVR